MEYQEKIHPTVGILVRSNGEVFVPANGVRKAHWTFGSKNDRGYMRVKINGKAYKVHRLVAEAFIPNPKNLPEIDHLNRDPQDNRCENLSWCSPSQNCRNRRDNDRVDARGGTHCYDDYTQYERERSSRRCKAYKKLKFSDGHHHYIPNSEALLLLAIPVNQRIFIKK